MLLALTVSGLALENRAGFDIGRTAHSRAVCSIRADGGRRSIKNKKESL
jgi:hypothetical protein